MYVDPVTLSGIKTQPQVVVGMTDDLEEAGWYMLVAVFIMLWMLLMMLFA
jgi:hypothetical protein